MTTTVTLLARAGYQEPLPIKTSVTTHLPTQGVLTSTCQHATLVMEVEWCYFPTQGVGHFNHTVQKNITTECSL